MKQFILIALLTSISFSALNAQSLQIGVGSKDVTTGSEVYFFSTYPASTLGDALQVYLRLTNLTNETINIRGLTTPVETPFGTHYQWCGFGNCWGTYTIPFSEMEGGYTEGANNDTRDEFYADVKLNDSFDVATYKLSFWVAINDTLDNVEDNVEITIHFVEREHIPADILDSIGGVVPQRDTIIFISGGYIPVAANEIAARSQNTIRVYPNPAIDYITFDLGNEKSNVIIRSTSGSVVRKIMGASGFASTNVKGLAGGIYFYTIERLNGERTTGKLIVK
jgi:hypothetical protein